MVKTGGIEQYFMWRKIAAICRLVKKIALKKRFSVDSVFTHLHNRHFQWDTVTQCRSKIVKRKAVLQDLITAEAGLAFLGCIVGKYKKVTCKKARKGGLVCWQAVFCVRR